MGHSASPALQDYISLFPLDDMQPSKLMRLLSSNEDDANILSSPSECGDRGWAGCVLSGSSLLPEGGPALGQRGWVGVGAVLSPRPGRRSSAGVHPSWWPSVVPSSSLSRHLGHCCLGHSQCH